MNSMVPPTGHDNHTRAKDFEAVGPQGLNPDGNEEAAPAAKREAGRSSRRTGRGSQPHAAFQAGMEVGAGMAYEAQKAGMANYQMYPHQYSAYGAMADYDMSMMQGPQAYNNAMHQHYHHHNGLPQGM